MGGIVSIGRGQNELGSGGRCGRGDVSSRAEQRRQGREGVCGREGLIIGRGTGAHRCNFVKGGLV